MDRTNMVVRRIGACMANKKWRNFAPRLNEGVGTREYSNSGQVYMNAEMI